MPTGAAMSLNSGQAAADRQERCVEVGADRGYGDDDGDGDQSSDKTIFDGCDAGLINQTA